MRSNTAAAAAVFIFGCPATLHARHTTAAGAAIFVGRSQPNRSAAARCTSAADVAGCLPAYASAPPPPAPGIAPLGGASQQQRCEPTACGRHAARFQLHAARGCGGRVLAGP